MKQLKTYQDYLKARTELEAKGIQLKEIMKPAAFDAYYERLREAKRIGEIKSQPWQHLLSKERLVTRGQARALAKAATDQEIERRIAELDKKQLSIKEYNKEFKKISKIKFTQKDIFKMNTSQIANIGAYLNLYKSTGLYGGSYE